MRAASSSSVERISRSKAPEASAVSMVYAMSGLPASRLVFLPGMPLEPARAVTTPRTVGFAGH